MRWRLAAGLWAIALGVVVALALGSAAVGAPPATRGEINHSREDFSSMVERVLLVTFELRTILEPSLPTN
jgi:hypothetical protein